MKVPQGVVPLLLVVFAALGVAGARLLAVPSVVRNFAPPDGRRLLTTVFVVDGVRCVDTAERAANQLQDVPGAVRFVAYASRNRVEITFDPTQIEVPQLRDALEGPVYDSVSEEYLFSVYKVVEVDGVKVARRE